MYLKQRFFFTRCLCHRASRAETPGGQTNRRFKCIVYKTYTKYYEISNECVEK